jgi:GT2 family glycosyltransferase
MITVIIPVYNNADYTEQCIKSICLKNIQEIIVVDNGSTDNTPQLLQSLPVKVITLEKNIGFGKACNMGLHNAKSEYIYFLNNDTILNTTTITTLLDRIQDNRLGAVGSKVISPEGKIREAGGNINSSYTWQRGIGSDGNEYNDFEIVDYCSACSLLTRKSLITKGFDEVYGYGYYEDVDLCMQIKKQGYLIGYEPLSTIIHFEQTTSRNVIKDVTHLSNTNRSRFLHKWELV